MEVFLFCFDFVQVSFLERRDHALRRALHSSLLAFRQDM